MKGEVWSTYIHGEFGSGKSCFAAALLMHRRAKQNLLYPYFLPGNLGGIWHSTGKLSRMIRDLDGWRYNGPILEKIAFYVLDDLGAQRSTPHLTEQLLFLLLARYEQRLSTLITSNLSLEKLAESFDARIASRLQDGVIVYTGDKDLRNKKENQNAE